LVETNSNNLFKLKEDDIFCTFGKCYCNLILSGVSMAMYLSIASLCDKGENILVPSPGIF
jgi:hypothetical protein